MKPTPQQIEELKRLSKLARVSDASETVYRRGGPAEDQRFGRKKQNGMIVR